jgi:hypothetical protein
MRVLDEQRLQFLVPALESEVSLQQVADLCLEPLDLRLKLADLLG